MNGLRRRKTGANSQRYSPLKINRNVTTMVHGIILSLCDMHSREWKPRRGMKRIGTAVLSTSGVSRNVSGTRLWKNDMWRFLA